MSFNPYRGNARAAMAGTNTFSDNQNYEGLITYGKKNQELPDQRQRWF